MSEKILYQFCPPSLPYQTISQLFQHIQSHLFAALIIHIPTSSTAWSFFNKEFVVSIHFSHSKTLSLCRFCLREARLLSSLEQTLLDHRITFIMLVQPCQNGLPLVE